MLRMRNEKADRRNDYERLEEDEWEGKKEARNPNFLRQVTCQYRESLDRRRRRKSEFLPRASTFFSSEFGQLRSFTGRHTWIRTMLHFSSVPVAMSSTASMPNVLETRNIYKGGCAPIFNTIIQCKSALLSLSLYPIRQYNGMFRLRFYISSFVNLNNYLLLYRLLPQRIIIIDPIINGK